MQLFPGLHFYFNDFKLFSGVLYNSWSEDLTLKYFFSSVNSYYNIKGESITDPNDISDGFLLL